MKMEKLTVGIVITDCSSCGEEIGWARDDPTTPVCSECQHHEEIATLRAEVARHEEKDGGRTREHNILVRENRKLRAGLSLSEEEGNLLTVRVGK